MYNNKQKVNDALYFRCFKEDFAIMNNNNNGREMLHFFLQENKMSFSQFIRTINFAKRMSEAQLDDCIEAYKNGEFKEGWY